MDETETEGEDSDMSDNSDFLDVPRGSKAYTRTSKAIDYDDINL